MRQRVFVGISLPEKIKKHLTTTIQKWQDFPVKWTPENKLHLTIVFLGFVDLEDISEISQKLRTVAESEEIFDMEFNSIEIAPDKDNPQMIWLKGNSSRNLLRIREKIEKALDIFVSEKKDFRPHITLGRIRKHKWEALAKKPEISEKMSFFLSVDSINLFASHFKGSGNEYTILESCPLR